jgi:hypothetical protein
MNEGTAGEKMRRRMLPFFVAVASCLAICACETDEFVRVLGQALYDAGHYVCTQSSNCDVPADDREPAVSPNRR